MRLWLCGCFRVLQGFCCLPVLVGGKGWVLQAEGCLAVAKVAALVPSKLPIKYAPQSRVEGASPREDWSVNLH